MNIANRSLLFDMSEPLIFLFPIDISCVLRNFKECAAKQFLKRFFVKNKSFLGPSLALVAPNG